MKLHDDQMSYSNVNSGFRQEYHWIALPMRMKKDIRTTRPNPFIHEILDKIFRDIMNKENCKGKLISSEVVLLLISCSKAQEKYKTGYPKQTFPKIWIDLLLDVMCKEAKNENYPSEARVSFVSN